MSSQPIVIDTKMHGRDGITGAFIVEGRQRALVETGPKSSIEYVSTALDAAGIDAVDWIVVTHIHLDHAGAAGTLAARWPEARVAVHTVGAPHLADPAKLWASAARIYGDEMDALWGGIDPIDPDRIAPLADGDVVELGGRRLTAVDTPGHASHHHAFVDDATGIMFAGDALGVRLPDIGVMRPATPPPEFNLETAIKSIERLRSRQPTELWLTHFGAANVGAAPLGVDEVCDEAIAALRQWESWVRKAREQTTDLDEVAHDVSEQARAALEGGVDSAAIQRMEQTTSYRMNTWGYMRYFDKTESAA
jgi:glyoxylase-like metal-dependent hydrolase (beta-lactamase superfamily II)